MIKRFCAGVLFSAALTGCASLAPEYERPDIELPETWTAPGGDSAGSAGDQWWRFFADATLDRLVDEALAHNADLELAVARVDEARAQLGLTRADQFPSVDALANGNRSLSSRRTGIPLPAGTPRERNNFRAALDVTYEVDLWGRLRNATEAARAELLATDAARETVRISLIADVVQGYFSLRALDEQLAATRRSLAARSESLALQSLRHQQGLISEFEYRQLEAEVFAARAQLPVLRRQRSEQEGALAVLIGKSPGSIYQDEQIAAAVDEDRRPPPMVVPSGVPSELLLRRPDLVESEQRLIATHARIGVARAAYFPSISLTGFLGGESESLNDLFAGGAGIWQLAGSLTQPIWDNGRIRSRVEAAEARQRQALAEYRQDLRNAFKDVRDAIVAQSRTREQVEAEDDRVAALRETLRLARTRYQNGVASQLDVLDAERNLLTAQLSRSDALRAQHAAIADLFKALGGGWEASLSVR